MHDPKPRPNDRLYLQVLRSMTPEQRLRKAFELSDFSKRLFLHGLKERHPNASDVEFQRIMLHHLAKCHNNNY